VRRREDRATLITDAQKSFDDEFDHRRKRYALMMTLRAGCVVAAALTYRISVLLALGFVVAGAILPWCAVVMANDRPPKKRATRLRRPGPPMDRTLPSGSNDRVIDG
jgi:Flp pilus assembly protein TadB